MGRGALLGPEESGRLMGAGLFSLGSLADRVRLVGVWLGPGRIRLLSLPFWGLFLQVVVCFGVCPYFENCIVDASIL